MNPLFSSDGRQVVSLLNELCDIFSGCGSEGEDVVNESFPDERF